MSPLFGGSGVLSVIDHVLVAYFDRFCEAAGQGVFEGCGVWFCGLWWCFCGGGGVVDYFQGDFCD